MRYSLPKNGERFCPIHGSSSNVCVARRPGWIRYKGVGSIVSDDDDRDAPKRIRASPPETCLRRAIVSEKRAKSTCEVQFTSRNSPRRELYTFAASGEIPVGIFRSGALHASDRPTDRPGEKCIFLRNGTFPPSSRSIFKSD